MTDNQQYQYQHKKVTSQITDIICQKLNTLSDPDHRHIKYNEIYNEVYKNLTLHILSATDSLVSRRGIYRLDRSEIERLSSILDSSTETSDDNSFEENEYSICEANTTLGSYSSMKT